MPSLLDETEWRSSTADPDRVAHFLTRCKASQPEAFRTLSENTAARPILLSVFANSNFLSEEIIQHPDWVADLAGSPELYRVLSAEEFAERLEKYLGPDSGSP